MKKVSPAPNWDAIFKKRPDLNPPGYNETCAKIQQRKLTNGKVHATDYTNASRTLLFNIIEKKWDPELCRLLDIPPSILPLVKKSVDDYGVVESIPEIADVPIFGDAGDQQAALFGQACFKKGQSKNTYGTGCFLLMKSRPSWPH